MKLLLCTVNDIRRNCIIILPRQQISLHASSRILMPVQDKPPHEGVGLLHDLVAFLIPPPQVLLHDPSAHVLQPPSTIVSLHASSRILMPIQDKPPHEGVGLLHDLVAFLIPPPQVLLHNPSVHVLQPPSTTE